jgi:hypothetical protein
MRRFPRAVLLLLLLVLPLLSVAAYGSGDEPFAFVCINPGAALSFLDTGFVVHSILPTAIFGQEAGVALGLGYSWNHVFAEGRISAGPSNPYHLVLQTQVSWNWRFAQHAGWLKRGPYLGIALRYWDLVQIHAGIHAHNVAPLLNLGWWLDIGPLFLDVRLSQVFLVAGWSNLPHSLPGVALTASPLPGISPWLPIGLIQVGVRL